MGTPNEDKKGAQPEQAQPALLQPIVFTEYATLKATPHRIMGKNGAPVFQKVVPGTKFLASAEDLQHFNAADIRFCSAHDWDKRVAAEAERKRKIEKAALDEAMKQLTTMQKDQAGAIVAASLANA